MQTLLDKVTTTAAGVTAIAFGFALAGLGVAAIAIFAFVALAAVAVAMIGGSLFGPTDKVPAETCASLGREEPAQA